MAIYAPHLISTIHDNLTRLAVALAKPNLVSPSSLALLCGVVAVESDVGYYLRQFPTGPACGIFQMEPATASGILRYLDRPAELYDVPLKSMRAVIEDSFAVRLPQGFDDWKWLLPSNLGIATVFARMHFARVTTPLPDATDIYGLANYWKIHYNTLGGKGKTDEFVSKFNLWIAPHLRDYAG